VTAYEFLTGNDVIVEIAPGVDRLFSHYAWPWVDITDDVRVNDRIVISQGRDNEANTVDAGTCNLVLDNRSGDYCRTNPLGAYYGTLGRNTPLRVRVRAVRDAFGRTTASGWGTADSGQAWTTAGGSATDYATSGGAATMLLGTVNVSRRATLTTVDMATTPSLDVAATFSASAVAVGNPLRAGLVLCAGADPSTDHYRAQLNFELSGVLSISMVKRVAGTDTTLDTDTLVDTYSANTQVRVRVNTLGSTVVAKAWLAANAEPDTFNVTSAGDTAFTTGAVGIRCIAATGNTNVSPVISTRDFGVIQDRFVGDVPEWAPRWDKSAVDQRVAIQAAGILRRLQQGAAPLKSSMFRYVSAASPSAYWALEDGEAATQGASGVQGQPPLRLTSGTSQGFGSGLAGAGQPTLLSLAGHNGVLSANISGVSSSRWTLEFAFNCPVSSSAQIRRPISWFTTGTYSRWDIEIDTAGDANLYATSSAGRTLVGTWGGVDGSAFLDLMAVEADQNGATLDITLWLGSGFDMDNAAPTATLGAIYRVMLNPYGDNLDDAPTIAHVAIYSDVSVDADTIIALEGFSGDGTYERMTRLASEESIPLEAVLGTAQFMGEQGTKTLVEMFREAEAAEQGLIFESGAGLAFRRLPELYNRPEGLTLETSSGHLSEAPEPTDDDQRLRNDVKVTRASGSSARYESENPAYLPSVVGRYDEELTLNLAFDTVLQQFAEWRVWLGTQDDLRWPRITFDMASRPALIEPWLRRRIGDRCTVSDPPAGVPPTALELVIEGYTETIGEAEWNVTLNCSPMRPYEIATIEGVGGYEEPAFILDHASSTLNTTIDSDDTSLSIATTGGTFWSTVDEPYDIEIGGEQMTVTTATGASSPQTFTVTRSVNGIVKAHTAGAAVMLWRPPVLGL
jgi:hypothetical protein